MAGVPTYIAFLRAINVGKRMFAKGAIVQACEDVGCTDVVTYINTGNVRLTTSLRSRAKVEEGSAGEGVRAAAAGFEVPTIVFTPKELSAVASDADDLAADHSGLLYVSLLKDTPTAAAVKKLDGIGKEGERAEVRGRAAYLLLGKDYHSAKRATRWSRSIWAWPPTAT